MNPTEIRETLPAIRDAILVAVPIVWGAVTVWRRSQPALNRMRAWFNQPVVEELKIVKDDVRDLQVHVDAIERTQ